MATYTIVSSTTDPLGPGEIAAGGTIQVSAGDVFIIDATADAQVIFEASGGTTASFDIVINDSNANHFALDINVDLTPTITVADNVDAPLVDIDAKTSDAINFVAGNNVTMGKYDGSVTGVDTVTIGDGFTATQEWKTSGGDDVVTIGDNATFNKISTEDGDDTIIIGAGATITTIDGGVGTDTLNTQTTGFTVNNVETTHVVCYAPGTLIDTPDGPRAVEDLQIGNLVNTLDNGPQPIRWLRSSDYPLEQVEPDDKPVLIAAGALGRGLPAQDLIVSPQHRMFVGGFGQLDGWFKTESFAPAKSLTALKGIRHMKGKQSIRWIHFACDRHEVVTANGCLSESLLLGPMVVNGLTRLKRQELTALYGAAPTPSAALNGPAARECLKVGEVRRHLAKCTKEKQRATAKEINKWDIDLAMEQWEADRLGITPSKSQRPNIRLAS